MASIYALCDQDGEIRYIGKAEKPFRRLKEHMREIRRRSPLYDWLAKFRDPMLLVVEDDCADWQVAEREWIAAARAAGVRLLNIADGGDQPHCSLKQRRSNAVAMNARRAANPRAQRIWEIRRAIAQGLRQGQVNNDTRAKLRLAAAKAPHICGDWANLPDRVEA